MKSRSLWLMVLAVLTGLVALVFAYPEPMISPGPMLAAHQSLSTNCFACHSAFKGSTADKCVSCHAVDKIGVYTTTGQAIVEKPSSTSESTPQSTPKSTPKSKGFHQQLTEPTCTNCHSEHRGETKLRSFSHELLKPQLQQKCASCHTAPSDKLHQKLDGGCAQCHTNQQWRPASFDHSKFFVLDGEHNARCTTCHVDNDFSRYTCLSCHQHTAAGVRAQHAEEGIRNIDNCVECHRSAHETEGGEGHESGRERN